MGVARLGTLPWSRLARGLVAALLLGLAAWWIDIGAVLTTLRREHLLGLLAAQPAQLLSLAIVAFRFWVLIPGRRPALGRTFKAYLLSVGLNTVLPGRLSELLKITALQRQEGASAAALTSAVVLERCTDLVLFAVLLCIGLGGAWARLDPLLLAGLAVTMLVVLLALPELRPIARRLAVVVPLPRPRAFLAAAYDHLGQSVRTPRFLVSLLLGTAGWAVGFVVVWTVLAVTDAAGIRFALAIYAAVALGRALPGLPGGLGTYEAAAVFALSYYGYPLDEALALALALHTSQIVLPTVAAGLIVAFDHAAVLCVVANLSGSRGTRNTHEIREELQRAA
jgi:uncharacterized membrane protein YbhN (UPF0104 family)